MINSNNTGTSTQLHAEWTNRDSLDGSILGTPQFGDVPYDTPFGFGRYGWICPKCGRVMAPDTPFCYFCSGDNKVDVTTNTKSPTDAVPDLSRFNFATSSSDPNIKAVI